MNCPADLHYWDGRHHWFKAIYVNQTHNTSELQWWEAELPAIRAREHTYLKRRLRAFSGDHEDLLNITLFDLAKHVRKFERVHPASWFQTSPPEDASEVARYHALAHKILRRRISDLFRKRVPLISFSDSEQPINVPDDNTPTPYRKLLAARLLKATISALDEMDPQDRDLIALISDDEGVRLSLNPRDRQRLHRARKKLKNKIASRLGIEVKDLLK